MPRRNRNSGTFPPDNAWLASELADLADRLGIPYQPAPSAPTAKAVTPLLRLRPGATAATTPMSWTTWPPDSTTPPPVPSGAGAPKPHSPH